MLKYATVAALGFYLYTQRSMISSYFSHWIARKLDFEILSITKPSFNPLTGELSFNVNFSFNNFLPVNMRITSLLIELFVEVNESGRMVWKKLAVRDPDDAEKTVDITPGVNQNTVRVKTPVKASVQTALSATISRLLYNQPQRYKVYAKAKVQDQPMPIETTQIFTI